MGVGLPFDVQCGVMLAWWLLRKGGYVKLVGVRTCRGRPDIRTDSTILGPEQGAGYQHQ